MKRDSLYRASCRVLTQWTICLDFGSCGPEIHQHQWKCVMWTLSKCQWSFSSWHSACKFSCTCDLCPKVSGTTQLVLHWETPSLCELHQCRMLKGNCITLELWVKRRRAWGWREGCVWTLVRTVLRCCQASHLCYTIGEWMVLSLV